jgi:hypothetical protein
MMKTKILIAVLVSLLMILAVSPGIPAGNRTDEQGQDADKGPKAPPEIGMVTFVNIPYWNTPPWYPDGCDENAETYRLVRGGLQWGILPVDCTVYTSGAPTGAINAITPAFDEWEKYTSTNIYGTISVNDQDPPPMNGSNTVSWGIIDGLGGAIAVTQFMFWVNTKELIKFDIIFDVEEPWALDGSESAFDVQNVMTHELGHTLVLDDLRSPRDGALTMHAYTWPGDVTKSDLGLGDILGIQAIYGAP